MGAPVGDGVLLITVACSGCDWAVIDPECPRVSCERTC